MPAKWRDGYGSTTPFARVFTAPPQEHGGEKEGFTRSVASL
jgi:hypothetical protein